MDNQQMHGFIERAAATPKSATGPVAIDRASTYITKTRPHFSRCMMDGPILERRRLLQLFTLGSLALPAAMLAGCAQGSGAPGPRRFHGGGGNDRGGGGGGMGGKGS